MIYYKQKRFVTYTEIFGNSIPSVISLSENYTTFHHLKFSYQEQYNPRNKHSSDFTNDPGNYNPVFTAKQSCNNSLVANLTNLNIFQLMENCTFSFLIQVIIVMGGKGKKEFSPFCGVKVLYTLNDRSA